jgi:Transcription factor WhiB
MDGVIAMLKSARIRRLPDFTGALCRADPDLFFTPRHTGSVLAREFCEKCPVREACHAYALEIRPTYGVWAGRTAAQLAKEGGYKVSKGRYV